MLKLCNEARKLGSSAGILSASTRLRERLDLLLRAFRSNAQKLHPKEMEVHICRQPFPLRHGSRWKDDILHKRPKHAYTTHNTNSGARIGKKWRASTHYLIAASVNKVLVYCVDWWKARSSAGFGNMDLAQTFRSFLEDIENLFDCFDQFHEFMEEIPDPSFTQELHVCVALWNLKAIDSYSHVQHCSSSNGLNLCRIIQVSDRQSSY